MLEKRSKILRHDIYRQLVALAGIFCVEKAEYGCTWLAGKTG